jgi:DNA repair protein RadC
MTPDTKHSANDPVTGGAQRESSSSGAQRRESSLSGDAQRETPSSAAKPAKQKSIHDGHRARKKAQLLSQGTDGWSEHEILEVLLYFGIPYGDTNAIAHMLIDRFGCLKSVIDADYNDLVTVTGVGAHTASMIAIFRIFAQYYLTLRLKSDVDLHNTESVYEFCRALFLGKKTEEVRCIFLDDELHFKSEKKICDGTPGAVELPFRTIAESTFAAKTCRVILTHNHPNGIRIPSYADINVTRDLYNALRHIQIELVDHVIIGRDGEWSMRAAGNPPDIWNE